MSAIRDLYTTLEQRRRPEDVAQMILELLHPQQITSRELSILEKAAAGALKRIQYQYTSMLEQFSAVKGAGKQLRKACELFHLTVPDLSTAFDQPAEIETFIREVSPVILKDVGRNDFRQDRLNKSERAELGIDLSKRNYNKKWRLLKRLEQKLATIIREHKKLEFQKTGKHGLTSEISFSEFSMDINTACFIAYIVSRGNLRSEFTILGQQRPFDEIADMLLKRCEAEPKNANWQAIAFVYTSQRVLKHLTDQQKGELLGKWTSVLEQVAGFLQELWEENNFYRRTMIVKRGDDSSTWNNTAAAWNKSRDSWINLIYSLGLESILDEICFGKVMRLMAGDVAYWHQAVGGKLDPNTEVWNELPLPWEVFHNEVVCTKSMVIDSCARAGIDPAKTGWIAPREIGLVAFKPTPELVHGVTIHNPFLAKLLKKHKYFSGKNFDPLHPELN